MFALNKQAQRMDYTEGQEPAVPSGDDNTQTGGNVELAGSWRDDLRDVRCKM